ncbi:MAG: L-histidine N(alpha)-methyltransferase, partial [Phycisphaerae bacterium]
MYTGQLKDEDTAEQADSIEAMRDEVLCGLRGAHKTLPCKLLYDRRGSKLFDRICELDAYYPTRTELAIMHRYAGDMAEAIGPHSLLIEYGSGSSLKTRLLLDHLDSPAAYVPVDISREHLHEAA